MKSALPSFKATLLAKCILSGLLAFVLFCSQEVALADPPVWHVDLGDKCHAKSDPHFHFNRTGPSGKPIEVKISLITGQPMNAEKAAPLTKAEWKKILQCRVSRERIANALSTLSKNGIKSALASTFSRNLACKAAQKVAASSLGKISLGCLFGKACGVFGDVLFNPGVCHAAELPPPWMYEAERCYEVALQIASVKSEIFENQCKLRYVDYKISKGFICQEAGLALKKFYQGIIDDLTTVLFDAERDINECLRGCRPPDDRAQCFLNSARELAGVTFDPAAECDAPTNQATTRDRVSTCSPDVDVCERGEGVCGADSLVTVNIEGIEGFSCSASEFRPCIQEQCNKPFPKNTCSQKFKLTVSKSGAGSGMVSSVPSGISCGRDCVEEYLQGASVNLVAVASTGSVFAGWSGDCSGTGSCTVSMSKIRNVSAVFRRCQPVCDGRTCGGDGCGGICACPTGKVCNATGQCISSCVPNCLGKGCGSDGCGGTCGSCAAGFSCNAAGQCQSTCRRNCTGKSCGSDGCGGTCGSCAAGFSCNAAGQCQSTCRRNCTGKSCGSDGCGGSCGTCAAGATCTASGQCQSACTRNCTGKSCGSDGCGGSCGTCAAGATCTASGQCQSTCRRNCTGKSCGSDGCGGSCGACAGGSTCVAATGKCMLSVR
jgi:hypothetical protein